MLLWITQSDLLIKNWIGSNVTKTTFAPCSILKRPQQKKRYSIALAPAPSPLLCLYYIMPQGAKILSG